MQQARLCWAPSEGLSAHARLASVPVWILVGPWKLGYLHQEAARLVFPPS